MVVKRYGGLMAAVLVMSVGCRDEAGERKVKTSTELNVEKMDRSKCAGFPFFADMADNAILQDMSIADIHFVTHTAEISGTGAVRLDRMANLLEAYGGTVRYETYLEDVAMVEQRLRHVTEYLTLTGCNMSRVQVKAMMSGGRTIPASDAIAAMEKGTSKNPGQGAAPAGQGFMAPASP